MNKIEHLGIAVHDLEASNALFEKFWECHIIGGRGSSEE